MTIWNIAYLQCRDQVFSQSQLLGKGNWFDIRALSRAVHVTSKRNNNVLVYGLDVLTRSSVKICTVKISSELIWDYNLLNKLQTPCVCNTPRPERNYVLRKKYYAIIQNWLLSTHKQKKFLTCVRNPPAGLNTDRKLSLTHQNRQYDLSIHKFTTYNRIHILANT